MYCYELIPGMLSSYFYFLNSWKQLTFTVDRDDNSMHICLPI